RVWDTESGRERYTLRGHTARVLAVAFSPDGRRLTSAGSGQDPDGGPLPGDVRVWDTATGQELLTLPGTYGVSGLAWDPDGRTLAGAASDKPVKLWEADPPEQLLTPPGPPGKVEALAWSPDGRRLAAASQDGALALLDPDSGQEVLPLPRQPAQARGLAFSPDAKLLAVGTGRAFAPRQLGEVRVLDAATGQPVHVF